MPWSLDPRRRLKAEQPLLMGDMGSILDTAVRACTKVSSSAWLLPVSTGLQSSLKECQGKYATRQEKAMSHIVNS